MPDGKPTIAPLVILGTMVVMSIITMGIVLAVHSQRTEPYLDTKFREVRKVRVKKPKPAQVAPSADNGGAEKMGAEDAGAADAGSGDTPH